jgi:C-terminal processing protease CtpA/Prc
MDPALIDRPTEDMAVTISARDDRDPAVQGQMLPGGVALVELHHFSNVASKLAAAEAREFQSQGMRAVVLDLRATRAAC